MAQRPGQPRPAQPKASTQRQSTGRPGQRRAPQHSQSEPPRPLAPALPDDVRPEELDRDVRQELRSLPESLAGTVAKHLVAAGRLLDDEPERARAHAAYARAIAPRIASVREAAGISAYLVGDYAGALAELRAARRMTGRPDHLPILADCERGLGRPERALGYANDPQAALLDPAARAELRIVESGARRDLGDFPAAVAALAGPELDPKIVAPWTARLWYAYAEALLSAGRREEARRWFAATETVDEDGQTDAAERLAALSDEPA